MSDIDKLRYLMGTIVSPWLMQEPLRRIQMKQLLAFVYQIMTDHAKRAAYWRENRVQVDWDFRLTGDGSVILNVSTTVGSGCNHQDDSEVVICVD